MCMKLAKGAMQGPLGDIGRHGNLDLMQQNNIQETKQGGNAGFFG